MVDVAGSIVTAAVGVVFLGLGLELRSDQAPYADGIVTTATTTSFRIERSVNRHRTTSTIHYRPVYTFQTPAGETTTYDDPITVSSPPQLGRTVELSFRANEPGKARVIRGWHGWTGFPIIFTVIGTVLLALVAYFLKLDLTRRRADRRGRPPSRRAA